MLNTRSISTGIGLLIVAAAAAAIALLEWRTLFALDHPVAHKVSCVTCHTDVHTLDAIASKSNDPLYLVHSGDLTLHDLNRLRSASAPRKK